MEFLGIDEQRPERAPLRLLHTALAVAQAAVRAQHPRLQHPPIRSHPTEPSHELLAELLVQRCDELEVLIERYSAVVDYVLSPDDDPF